MDQGWTGRILISKHVCSYIFRIHQPISSIRSSEGRAESNGRKRRSNLYVRRNVSPYKPRFESWFERISHDAFYFAWRTVARVVRQARGFLCLFGKWVVADNCLIVGEGRGPLSRKRLDENENREELALVLRQGCVCVCVSNSLRFCNNLFKLVEDNKRKERKRKFWTILIKVGKEFLVDLIWLKSLYNNNNLKEGKGEDVKWIQ